MENLEFSVGHQFTGIDKTEEQNFYKLRALDQNERYFLFTSKARV